MQSRCPTTSAGINDAAATTDSRIGCIGQATRGADRMNSYDRDKMRIALGCNSPSKLPKAPTLRGRLDL